MMRDYEVIKEVCEALWNSDDPDCYEAEEYGFKENIIELFTEYYDGSSFLEWLAKNNCNPANHFREAEVVEKPDDPEEWAEIQENALFFNNDYACIQW